MSFLRPEVAAALIRWREVAAGLAVVALGLWWALGSIGILRWIGVVLVLGGLLVAREGVARARRPDEGDAPGMVEVDERRIAYFSARGGGAVSIDALAEVEVVTTGHGAFWKLTQADGDSLSLPANATGAGDLFDALSALPGFPRDTATGAVRARQPGRVTLWRHPDALRPDLLH